MKSVGIVGFGSFGAFVAQKLDQHANVLVYARKDTGKWQATLGEVAQSDYVVLAVPLGSYEGVLRSLKPLLKHDTVIVDVCSVKQKPIELIRKVLPDQPIVATHPLFGPESAIDSVAGHTMVMCPEVSDVVAYEKIKRFAESLGVKIVEMPTEQHDQQMATVHGLTFFIARALDEMGIHDQLLETPSFRILLSLAELERHHSQELFESIQNGNQFSGAVRRELLETLERIDERLRGGVV